MVTKAVLKKVKPSKREEIEVKATAMRVINAAEEVISEFDKHVKVKQVGSTAKGTWLAGMKDIDIFVMFPTETYGEGELEEEALPLLHKICDKLGVKPVLTFAQHPYLKFDYKNHTIELVPSFKLTKQQLESELASPVDRTPHHTDFVLKRLRNRDDVRLLKQFCRGIGVYGADMKHQGFSGYLCELLVMKNKGFLGTIRAASKWNPEGEIVFSCRKTDGEPLVFGDPVDRYRNVASAVSQENFELFIEAAKAYLKKPSLKFFFPKNPRKMVSLSSERVFLYIFKKADELEDILYSQLRSFGRKAVRQVLRKGFSVGRVMAFVSKDKCFLLLGFDTYRLDKHEIVRGPPTSVHEFFKHAFTKKHDWEVYEKDGRLWAKKEREHLTPQAYLDDLLDEAPSKLRTEGSLLHGKLLSKFYKKASSEEKEFVTVALSDKRPWNW